MKKRYLIVMTLCSSLWLNAQNFIHPGMLHTQADLDRTKAKVEAGEEPWASAYRKLLTSRMSVWTGRLLRSRNRTRRPDDLGTRPGQLPVGLPGCRHGLPMCVGLAHIRR